MKDNEKKDLKEDILFLKNQGYTKREALEKLVLYGYSEDTARNYWKAIIGGK